MPTLQQLRYLVALGEERHFRRAAEVCGVTQPTLSAQLKELETRLDVALVERSRSRVLLTPVGRAVVERARRIFLETAEIQSVCAAMRSRFETTIRTGVVRSLGSYFLPLVIPDLHTAHPKLGLHIHEAAPETLLRDLEDGSLDVVFYPMPARRADFDGISLFREPIVVVAPRDHPLADAQAVDAEMLRGETVLSLQPDTRLWDHIKQLCDAYGARLSREFEGASLDVIRQMVAMGMGVSLMPALYVKSEVARHDIVVARPFKSTPPSITIGMIWRKSAAQAEDYHDLARLLGQILRKRAEGVAVLA